MNVKKTLKVWPVCVLQIMEFVSTAKAHMNASVLKDSLVMGEEMGLDAQVKEEKLPVLW